MPRSVQFICVQLFKAARVLQSGGEDGILNIGVGDSGYEFAKMVDSSSVRQPVTTQRYSRDRRNRELVCGKVKTTMPVRLIDDIAVTGKTLQESRAAITGNVGKVSLAMLFDSTSTRERIGQCDVTAAISYLADGGGRPPVNSIDSLLQFPERRNALSARYFGGSSDEFTELLQATVSQV